MTSATEKLLAEIEERLAKMPTWQSWWFVTGGQLHCFREDRQWKKIFHAAMTLPKLAWENSDRHRTDIEKLVSIVKVARECLEQYGHPLELGNQYAAETLAELDRLAGEA